MLRDMSRGYIPPETLTQAEDDADFAIRNRYQGCFDPNDVGHFDRLKRYYAAHLLYIWGFATSQINANINDITVGKQPGTSMGDKIGASPYFFEFSNLLNCRDGFDFLITSV